MIDKSDFIVLIFSLSLVSLLNYFICLVGDYISIHIEQKVSIYKVSLLMTFIFIPTFLVLKFFSLNVVVESFHLSSLSEKTLPAVMVQEGLHQGLWREYLFLFYVAFCVFHSLRLFISYIRVKVLVRHSVKKTFGESLEYNLIETGETPFCFGFFSPQIFVPKTFKESYSERQLELALRHERQHQLSFDPSWRFLSRLQSCLLFFMPTAYLFNKRFDLAMESYADYRVLKSDQENLSDYAHMLIHMVQAEKSVHYLATHMSDSTLKQRIKEMKSRKIERPLLKLLFMMTAVCSSLGIMAFASGTTKENDTLYKIDTKIYINGVEKARPRIILKEGKEGRIEMIHENGEELHVKVLAYKPEEKKFGVNKIGIDFDSSYKNGDKDKFDNKARLVVSPNRMSTFEVISDTGDHTYKVELTADKRVKKI